MPASIGVNLRVTGHCRQGGRKYMEDFFSVAYQQTEDERDLEYAFFGIYDGHGGAEAAAFAKEHLMETIVKHKSFWSDNDEDVLRAIKDGYLATHYAMWKEQGKWPRTASGLPSTAGTTASVAFIRKGKIYIGHVGDSGIILGYQEEGSGEWTARNLTVDHKPESMDEMNRINQCGGKVVVKSGVPRVVWNRPKAGHQGPVRRSTPIDEIPFLAVSRSLGDLWSYNSQLDQFVVSPEPDCSVHVIDPLVHRCLIFGTDGLFNMLRSQTAVQLVQQAERHNEHATLSDGAGGGGGDVATSSKTWLNPSKLLVEKALERWHITKMRADNTSVVCLMLDPPGPPRAQVLRSRKKVYPESGLKIMTRYDEPQAQPEPEVASSPLLSSPPITEVPKPRFEEPSEGGSDDKENVEITPSLTEEVVAETSVVADESIQINEISSSCCESDDGSSSSSSRVKFEQTTRMSTRNGKSEKAVVDRRKSSRIMRQQEGKSKVKVLKKTRVLRAKKLSLKKKIVTIIKKKVKVRASHNNNNNSSNNNNNPVTRSSISKGGSNEHIVATDKCSSTTTKIVRKGLRLRNLTTGGEKLASKILPRKGRSRRIQPRTNK